MSGIGWAMGLERLILACEGEGISLGEENDLDAYVVCLNESASVVALQLVTELRASGYKSEMDYLNRSFKAQFKTVMRRHARVAVLIGEDELAAGTVAVKNLETKEQQSVALDKMVETIDGIFDSRPKE